MTYQPVFADVADPAAGFWAAAANIVGEMASLADMDIIVGADIIADRT